MLKNSENNSGSNKDTILIVDDTPANLGVISNYLKESGFKTPVASNGELAIQRAKHVRPDLILLDILMPGMDGYETCQKLKEDPETSNIPIIFMTSLNDTEHKVKGFQSGAVDYISKPVEQDELLARVKTHLRIQNLQRQLQSRNDELVLTIDNLNQTREQLIESEKMAALGRLVASVAHEINTPLGVAITGASYVQEKIKELYRNFLEKQLTQSVFKNIVEQVDEMDEAVLRNLRRAEELIDDFKQIAVDQINFRRSQFMVKEYLRIILDSLSPKTKEYDLSIRVNCEDYLELTGYPGAFSQVITNLVTNSLTHAFQPDVHGEITIDVSEENDNLKFVYSDNGKGIPEENLSKIFEPFFTTRRGSGGTGLGMHIVYNLVSRKMNGSIRCESKVGEGTQFLITIPKVLN